MGLFLSVSAILTHSGDAEPILDTGDPVRGTEIAEGRNV
jgi:hypothetical protein